MCDCAVPEKLEDGTIVCYSSLTDISGLKKENENLQFLNETIPCGFIKYTCEKQPRITYINRQMMDFCVSPKRRKGRWTILRCTGTTYS